jgi:hypothetical protein
MSNEYSGESGYQKLLRDPRWQKKRLEVLEAAEWRCQDSQCNRDDLTLEVHHLYYIRGQKPWEYPPDAFLALCSGCHTRRQTLERALKIEMMKALRYYSVDELELGFWELLDLIIELRRAAA